ncbi:hypothetical protein [Bradyrhizobium uaiense]|uniref:Uncharacterized protein n=1 Tax=Bradyrhizobium uaiense TaxID=2594946 RepID=A0A6P1BX19_9BRAD|nr:hypothetical protein [Bradyrhizobium uaiense]NEV02261.1 hypothetical protein [Bradyrhizobium uaiense]
MKQTIFSKTTCRLTLAGASLLLGSSATSAQESKGLHAPTEIRLYIHSDLKDTDFVRPLVCALKRVLVAPISTQDLRLPLGKELFTAPMQLDAAKLAVHFNQATIRDGTTGEFKYLFLPYNLRAAAGYSTFHATFAVPNLVGAVSTTSLDVRDPNLPQPQMSEIIGRRFYKVMIRSIAQSAGLRGEGCTLAFPYGLAALDQKTSEFCPSDRAALVAASILKEKESEEGSDCFATSALEPIGRRARIAQSDYLASK